MLGVYFALNQKWFGGSVSPLHRKGFFVDSPHRRGFSFITRYAIRICHCEERSDAAISSQIINNQLSIQTVILSDLSFVALTKADTIHTIRHTNMSF